MEQAWVWPSPKRAFRLHEGKVTAANAPGGGLVVTLELPMLSPSHESVETPVSTPAS